MEKSIESIWQDGFLNKDALIAPKVNNLYNQKSKHIVDKYKRMFKMNIKLIIIGSFVLLLITFLAGMPFLGVPMFFMLNALAFVDKKLLTDLEKIDKNQTSYEYLKMFQKWMKRKTAVNRKMARFLYPVVFLSLILGFWFMKVKEATLGQIILNELSPDVSLLFGMPVFGIFGALVIVCFLAYFGTRFYDWDVKIVYGSVVNKIEEIIADMEVLRA